MSAGVGSGLQQPPVIIADLSWSDVVERARGGEFRYRTGPFNVALTTEREDFLATLVDCYQANELVPDDEPAHFRIRLRTVGGARRWFKPQVQFEVDGMEPFEPYPLDHAFPMYEWGVNWCIGTTGHIYLILHSAVVEKAGCAVLLPAIPGGGKSTLCAGLVSRGWRLLSDEFAIVRHADGMLMPLPRAAPLKNESIDVIRQYAPGLRLGPTFARTRKGTVVHMFPPVESIERQSQAAAPRWVIFPSFERGSPTELQPQNRAVALTKLSNNSFNYPVTMAAGFTSLTRLVRQVDCYELPNGDLDEAVQAVAGLFSEAVP